MKASIESNEGGKYAVIEHEMGVFEVQLDEDGEYGRDCQIYLNYGEFWSIGGEHDELVNELVEVAEKAAIET